MRQAGTMLILGALVTLGLTSACESHDADDSDEHPDCAPALAVTYWPGPGDPPPEACTRHYTLGRAAAEPGTVETYDIRLSGRCVGSFAVTGLRWQVQPAALGEGALPGPGEPAPAAPLVICRRLTDDRACDDPEGLPLPPDVALDVRVTFVQGATPAPLRVRLEADARLADDPDELAGGAGWPTSTSWTAIAGPPPALVWDEAPVDFGVIDRAALGPRDGAAHTVVLRNQGGRPVPMGQFRLSAPPGVLVRTNLGLEHIETDRATSVCPVSLLLPESIAPREQDRLDQSSLAATIVVTAAAPATFSGEVAFHAEDPEGGWVAVPFSGTIR